MNAVHAFQIYLVLSTSVSAAFVLSRICFAYLPSPGEQDARLMAFEQREGIFNRRLGF